MDAAMADALARPARVRVRRSVAKDVNVTDGATAGLGQDHARRMLSLGNPTGVATPSNLLARRLRVRALERSEYQIT